MQYEKSSHRVLEQNYRTFDLPEVAERRKQQENTPF